MSRLLTDFYLRTDVVAVARDLLGKILVTEFDGVRTSGRIAETEAYRAPDDRASHAWGNRLTPRTRVMFQSGGHAYVYLCYGIHHLFNVVSAPEGTAHAVLVRAVEPLDGLETMATRRNLALPTNPTLRQRQRLGVGPGALAQSLGLNTQHSGQSLLTPDSPVWLEDDGLVLSETEIASGPRIGVDYAGECAAWPWRFWVSGTPFAK